MTYTVSKVNQKKPTNNKQPQAMKEIDFDDDDDDEEGDENSDQVSPMKVDLIQLVHESNSRAAELFFQYCQSEEVDEKQELFDQIKSGLKVHTQLVEELYYPLLPETAKEDEKEEAQELVFEAEASNYVASMILDVLETMKPSDDYFDGKMAVLHKLCREQVKREEKDMFEKLKAAETEIDFEEIGQAALERRMEIEEEVASMSKRSKSKSKSSAVKNKARGGSSSRGKAKAASARGKKTSARSSVKKTGAKARSGAKAKAAASSKGGKGKAASSKSKASSKGKSAGKSKATGKSKAAGKTKAAGRSKAAGRANSKSAKKPASKGKK